MRLSASCLDYSPAGSSEADIRRALFEFVDAQYAQFTMEAGAAVGRVISMRKANAEYSREIKDDDSVGVGCHVVMPYSDAEVSRAAAASDRAEESRRLVKELRDYVVRHICEWNPARDEIV